MRAVFGESPRTPRVLLLCLCGLLLGVPGSAGLAYAQQKMGAAQEDPKAHLHVFLVQGNVYALTGDGGNITLQIGNDGILVVNAGRSGLSDKLLAAIQNLSDKPIRYLVDTDDDASNLGGNETIAKAGRTVAGGNAVVAIGESAGSTATVVAFQTVLDRMSAPSDKSESLPQAAWPTDTYTVDHKDLTFNDDSVRISHEPNAHTDGDSTVHFRRADVISAGDFFSMDSFPVIDLKRGGSIQGVIDALNNLMVLAIPKFQQGGSGDEGGTMIIPGHGRISDRGDLAFYQEMVTIIRDRIQDLIKKGMTLEQVKAAKPTLDYDERYGSTTGPWTTDMFIEAVYRGLTDKH